MIHDFKLTKFIFVLAYFDSTIFTFLVTNISEIFQLKINFAFLQNFESATNLSKNM